MASQIPDHFRPEVEALPRELRDLLDAELLSGNEIVAVTHSHPAPPVGACVMLARPVTTCRRASGQGLRFRESGGSMYDASFTDDAGFFFILEAPLPPADYPDMDAIREAANRPAASHASAAAPQVSTPSGSAPSTGRSHANATGLADRFLASMQIDFEKWHDGIGYDVPLLAQASDAELACVMPRLVPPAGWRDVEALAAIDRDWAREALRQALAHGNAEVRATVMQQAPALLSDAERRALLVRGLAEGTFYNDLRSVLDQVEAYHPPEIVRALFRGVLERPGDIATHYAAMLAFIHGKADSAFDWAHRPLFLSFNVDDRVQRRRALEELCGLLELDPSSII